MRFYLTILVLCSSFAAFAQVDYSVVSVPQEDGLEFVCITSENDFVCMPQVVRRTNSLNWYSNKVIDISPDGKSLAFISIRNNTTNIFIKNTEKKSGAIQRTKRNAITDFSYSPDGENIVFVEQLGKNSQVFQTSAAQGFACRQITDGNIDFCPQYSLDMSNIYFARQESKTYSIWSYNLQSNFLSSLTSGLTPKPLSDSLLLCTRFDRYGKGEIWRIDIVQGIEECILSDADKSFTNPSVSPDGKHILLVGSSTLYNGNKKYYNTDIYTIDIDSGNLQQLTHHAADDLSPIWSKDGKYIYFVSRRGNTNGNANVWRMNFK